MLQRQQPARVQSLDTFPEAVGPAEAFQFILDFIRRQCRVIGFTVAIFLALGFVYVFTTPPRYTATATLLLDTQDARLFQQQSMFGDMPTAIDTGTVDSQVQILKSEKVALAVIKNLNLTKDPEFTGPSGGLVGAVMGAVSNLFAGSAPASDFALTRHAVGVFESRLDVQRVGLTYVIAINFQSLSPDRAAEIANAVANAYIDDQLNAKYQAARRAGTWLQDRLRELREQAATAERAVVAFKTKNNIVEAGGRTINDQQLAELNSELVLAKSQVAEARAKVARVESVLQSNSPQAAIDATVADSLKDDVIQKLRSQYLELSAREADWSVKYGYGHLAVVNLRNQMVEIQNSIRNELQRIAQSYQSDLNIAEGHEASVQKQLDDAVSESQVNNQADIALRELESQAQTYRALYDNFLQRYMESVQQQSFPITNARVISAATHPLTPSHPRTVLVLALTMMGGLAFGVGAGIWREFADRVFRTSEQVETLLESDCIALVPVVRTAARSKDDVASGIKAEKPAAGPLPNSTTRRLPAIEVANTARQDLAIKDAAQKVGLSDSGREAQIARKMKSSDPAQHQIVLAPGILSTIVDAPFSAFAEAIRSIKVAVDLSPATGSGAKIIGFTSSVPNEGKSSLACVVGRLVAQTGSRTLLVDCDLRNPSLSRALSPGCTGGLLDVLSGKATLEQALWLDSRTNMRFLPVATKTRLAHSSEVIASAQTRSFFEKLRQSYDYIIVDFAPLMPIVDVRASMQLVDSYVYVIEWGRTRVEHVEQALQSARGIYDRLLGVVLNKVDLGSLGRYDGRGVSYYRDERYSRYGYTE
jgi:polysaccharide biosynthesis transport protein